MTDELRGSIPLQATNIKLENMNKYYQYSDEYKSLKNIFYNGEYYTIEEILDGELSDKQAIKLIKENLKIRNYE